MWHALLLLLVLLLLLQLSAVQCLPTLLFSLYCFSSRYSSLLLLSHILVLSQTYQLLFVHLILFYYLAILATTNKRLLFNVS